MPEITVPGANKLLKLFLQSVEASDLYLGLCTNSSQQSQLLYIVEPAGMSYSRLTISKTDWTITDNIAECLQKQFQALLEWGNVFGYFICDVPSGLTGNLIAIEQFSDGPYFVNAGDTIYLVPRLVCRS